MRIWASYYKKGLGWFRIFGAGMKWKDVTRHPLIFSERYKIRRTILIGKWRIGVLKNQNDN